ncbi:cupin domain-containing protein [Spirosoma fluminis]
MKPALLFWIFVLIGRSAFSQVVASTMYTWGEAPVGDQTGYAERIFLEGTAKGFSALSLQAITVPANQPAQPDQQLDEEALLIVKEGELALTLDQTKKTLGPGSVVIVMPGDFFRIDNKSTQPLTYYVLRSTSNEVPDLDLYRLAGGSFWVDGREVAPGSLSQSSIRPLFEGGTIMAKRLKVDRATLAPGASGNTSPAKSAIKVIVIRENSVLATIDGVSHKAQAGDVVFIGADVTYSVQNTGQAPCTYLSLEFE